MGVFQPPRNQVTTVTGLKISRVLCMMSSDDMLISIRLFRNPTLFVTPIQSHVVFLTFYNLDEGCRVFQGQCFSKCRSD